MRPATRQSNKIIQHSNAEQSYHKNLKAVVSNRQLNHTRSVAHKLTKV